MVGIKIDKATFQNQLTVHPLKQNAVETQTKDEGLLNKFLGDKGKPHLTVNST